MSKFENKIDTFLWTRENKVITQDRHHVPGLANLSHWDFKTAASVAEPHYHKDIFEFHCMIRGRRIFQVLEGDTYSTYIMTGNQASVTFPGQVHGYRDDFADPYEFYSLQLDVSDPYNLLGLSPEYSYELYQELLRMKKSLIAKNEHRLVLGATHLNMLRSAFNLFSTLDEVAIKTGVQFLTCFLFNLKYLNVVDSAGQIDKNISNTIDYIRSHYLDSPSIAELSAVSGYSQSYFKAKFKAETGITPADYVNTRRLEHAQDLLIHTNISISGIAAELNYSSVSYFCAAFKKMTHTSPAEYRRSRSTIPGNILS